MIIGAVVSAASRPVSVVRLAEVLREQAKTLQHDAKLKAEYDYLVRGFLRLAVQFERDMEVKKPPEQGTRKPAA
jgi:chromosome segregation and condensation protein ScpB